MNVEQMALEAIRNNDGGPLDLESTKILINDVIQETQIQWTSKVTKPGLYLMRHKDELAGNSCISYIEEINGDFLRRSYLYKNLEKDVRTAQNVNSIKDALFFGPIPA